VPFCLNAKARLIDEHKYWFYNEITSSLCKTCIEARREGSVEYWIFCNLQADLAQVCGLQPRFLFLVKLWGTIRQETGVLICTAWEGAMQDLWDAISGQQQFGYQDSAGGWMSIAFSPDG